MPFVGKPREMLRKGLEAGFQTNESLGRFTAEALELPLANIGGGNDSLSNLVDRLITAMDQDDRIPDLVAAARTERPRNVLLRDVEEMLDLNFRPFDDVRSPPPAVERKIVAQGVERTIVEAAGFPAAAPFIAELGEAEYRVCLISYRIEKGKAVYGTGLLVADDLVMTNHHVIACAQPPESAVVLPGSKISITFGFRNFNSETQVYKLVEQDWLVASDPYKRPDKSPGLDYALLRLATAAGKDRIGSSSAAAVRGHFSPVAYVPQPDEPLLILQHPFDRLDARPSPMRLTIGFVLDVDGPAIRHTANTSEGSSGSPVFDSRMDLIALHFWGDTGFNKAIQMGDILADLERRGLGGLVT
ncbi:trypsin-like peptidase domain-containing protein [Massilia sp. Leaf139]|uniref:trypsin-like peptidase domain-containing protein n=1 Tax=Massilia sp. Leaf139 TaxID=1736272 RepID=UPI000701EEDE|nr:trypsin-like peptidase domain-containing protein [Massilia sp. Leaf139]KQQ96695.1 hypothetical protein ASF77_01465 [Massilia sp. Leaf139]